MHISGAVLAIIFVCSPALPFHTADDGLLPEEVFNAAFLHDEPVVEQSLELLQFRARVLEATRQCPHLTRCDGCSGEECTACRADAEVDCCLDVKCKGCSGEQCGLCHGDHLRMCCISAPMTVSKCRYVREYVLSEESVGGCYEMYDKCQGCSGEQCTSCRAEADVDCCLWQQCRGCTNVECACVKDKLGMCCRGAHPLVRKCSSSSGGGGSAPTTPTPPPSICPQMEKCKGCSGEQCTLCREEAKVDCCLDRQCNGCSGEQCTLCKKDHSSQCAAIQDSIVIGASSAAGS